MSHSFRSHYFHIVWSTKNRADLITNNIQSRLYAYIGGIVKSHQGVLLQIGGTANHLHLLISIRNIDKLSYLIREIKSRTSVWVHSNFINCKQFAWQEGYGSFSVSHSAYENIICYIRNQEEHHKIMTFEDEFRTILKKHNIECEEKFIFG
ncbi:IS200/IS605 family transposase [Candidatus Berkiella aquae]|uniref:IS200/IS605 family transposase n=1 Tax=Candidatus Berkiella aquae TaxID=295108 RepID=A0A0Q9YFS0_9GAMM|nr:IS200/IS605 family transposase [Candidatus Berkiella aquae]MCS5709871.1 IS200/IS605 family transposase [Candidatus Berkiella aquae]